MGKDTKLRWDLAARNMLCKAPQNAIKVRAKIDKQTSNDKDKREVQSLSINRCLGEEREGKDSMGKGVKDSRVNGLDKIVRRRARTQKKNRKQ